ncbi:membrane-bound hydrogenase subunit ehbG [Methanobrevibacter gottschalkii]|uniref:Membrane-bound hydrogenase subunit ehbG n=2 Tax=Methanobrevibacter gottschalkii TaxID=190974 RepID=A0A3N5C817_9EURY|nr:MULTISPECIES: hydrogenase [Methanobrevibacter]MCQ2970189.1 hydrogenase [archaeon]OEC93833.1 hydrogenase [Methanobrevibacter sp. A27]RPF52671.1 membrane-bound hydrogenase subunit ehbG [Methanobrevibacter gottschalkii DSM 11977]SEK28317.1 membrane-bound hydrogenase subunit ehbG [Methanobrevibacter gottschalkii]
MSLYDKIFDVVKQFRKLFSPGPVTNADVSGSITAEIFLIVSLVLATILLRHISVLLAGLVILFVAVVLIINIPLIPKFKIEQEDSLDKMLFYAIVTLAIIGVVMYWGGNLV